MNQINFLYIAKSIYNNIKNVNFDNIFFKANYKNYFYIYLQDKIHIYLKSQYINLITKKIKKYKFIF